MSELSYSMMRTANQAREANDLRTESRKKNLLVLVMHYLSEEGYVESASSLGKESNLNFKKYEVCDNVDLDTILMEYESYHYVKFHKYPKITKKLFADDHKKHYRMNMVINDNTKSGGLKRSISSSHNSSLPRISNASNQPISATAALPPSHPHSQSHPPQQISASSAHLSHSQHSVQQSSSSAAAATVINSSNHSLAGGAAGNIDQLSSASNGHHQSSSNGHRPKSGKIPHNKNNNETLQNDLVNGNTTNLNTSSSSSLVVHGRQDLLPGTTSASNKSASGGGGGGAGSGAASSAAAGNRKSMGVRGGPIIDYRAMINQETRLNVEEDGGVVGGGGATGAAGRNYDPQDRLLKPLGGYFAYTGEWRELAMTISKDIYLDNPNVKWDDIIGLDASKQLIKEAVVYPIKYPQLFQGILSPWKGILLYGPPGTGKTMLAKAVATECNTTFFNISASSIVSKWRGDSEKLIRILFELARFHAPSTIFIDELESIMSQRGLAGGGGGDHEGSRRMKTELLVQMDGLAKTDDLVFLLAASNLPWELDHAMLRRLEKRILVDLPTQEARRSMLATFLPPRLCKDQGGLDICCQIDYDLIAQKTLGYSGSDLKLVSKEAAMRVIRKIFFILENHEEGNELQIRLDPVLTADLETVLNTTKPSAKLMVSKYEAWQREFESV